MDMHAAAERYVLVVDDEPNVLRALDRTLRSRGYRTLAVDNAERARDLLDVAPIEAVVTDLDLPLRTGGRFVSKAVSAHRQVPVIVVTGTHDLKRVFDMLAGALPHAVLPKPVDAHTLVGTLARVLHHVAHPHETDRVAIRQLAQSLMRAVALRDVETEAHARRVAMWSHSVSVTLGLSVDDAFWCEMGALLHDVGKIGMPDSILRKPSSLDPAEWEKMRMHPELGVELLVPIRRLERAIPLVLHHHERWDGRGYPHGLAGPAIPFPARIFAPIDAYDAMTADRPYRPGRSHQVAFDHLAEARGTQFDPDVIDAILATPEDEWLSVLRVPSDDDARDA